MQPKARSQPATSFSLLRLLGHVPILGAILADARREETNGPFFFTLNCVLVWALCATQFGWLFIQWSAVLAAPTMLIIIVIMTRGRVPDHPADPD